MDYMDSALSLHLPPDFASFAAAREVDFLRTSGADSLPIANFPTLGAKRNTLRAFALSLRPAAPGMQSFKNFIEVIGRRPCPVVTDTVLMWSNMFMPDRTFAQYVAHLTRAAILLKPPTAWMCPDIKAVVHGLANTQDLSSKFNNFLFLVDLLRLIRTARLTSEFGCEAFFRYPVFDARSVGGPSLSDGFLGRSDYGFYPQRGRRFLLASAILADAIFSSRKSTGGNSKRGCILRRHCICPDAESLSRVLCPSRRIWPQLAAQTRTGELIPLVWVFLQSPPSGESGLSRCFPGGQIRFSLFQKGGYPGTANSW